MPTIPDNVFKALQESDFPAVFSTVSTDGNPDSVWVAIVKTGNRESLLINDTELAKTRDNILAGSRGTVIFVTRHRKSYQIKGALKYHSSGSLYDYAVAVSDPVRKIVATVELVVDEVYEGAEKLV